VLSYYISMTINLCSNCSRKSEEVQVSV